MSAWSKGNIVCPEKPKQNKKEERKKPVIIYQLAYHSGSLDWMCFFCL